MSHDKSVQENPKEDSNLFMLLTLIHPCNVLHALTIVRPVLNIKANHTFNVQVNNMDQWLVHAKQNYTAA